MEKNKQRAIREVLKRLVDSVKEEFDKGNNPYKFEDRVVRIKNESL